VFRCDIRDDDEEDGCAGADSFLLEVWNPFLSHGAKGPLSLIAARSTSPFHCTTVDLYPPKPVHKTKSFQMSHALRSKHRNGDVYSAKKAKTRGGSKGNDGGVMGGGANNGAMPPPMMMPGYPMAGPMGYPMMMGNMMGMGPPGGVVGPGAAAMMANPMFQFEMQRAYFAQHEHMMQQAHQRMWGGNNNNNNNDPTSSHNNNTNSNNGGSLPPTAPPGDTGDTMAKAGAPADADGAPAPGAGTADDAPAPGEAGKDPGKTETADV
jgi:hypothetical protein